MGKGFSVHDTRVIAGGRPVRFVQLNRELIQAEIPGGVQTIPFAPTSPTGTAWSARTRIRLASATEPLPAPNHQSVLPSPHGTHAAASCDQGCQIACNNREMVEIHLATPYGVSGSLLVPVVRQGLGGGGGPRFLPGCGFALSFTTAKTAGSQVPNAKVDEFYGSSCDALEIAVPESFIPPAKAELRLVLRDESSGVTAATFSFANPFFDGSRGRYVIAGGELRNFLGDTSRPATDKTLRGAVKPYLDSLLATGGLAEDGDSVALALTAEIVAGERAVPVSGSVPITATRRGKTVTEPAEPPTIP